MRLLAAEKTQKFPGHRVIHSIESSVSGDPAPGTLAVLELFTHAFSKWLQLEARKLEIAVLGLVALLEHSKAGA